MGADSIKRDLQLLQISIKKLSGGVGRASTLWNDEKYAELAASVSELANSAKSVLMTGDRCCSSIDRFQKIAAEKY